MHKMCKKCTKNGKNAHRSMLLRHIVRAVILSYQGRSTQVLYYTLLNSIIAYQRGRSHVLYCTVQLTYLTKEKVHKYCTVTGAATGF